jgi:hypothetical protein
MLVRPRCTVADEVFILRFWQEQEDHGQEFRWRAQVRNVNTRERHTADDLGAAMALISKRLEAVASAAESVGNDD